MNHTYRAFLQEIQASLDVAESIKITYPSYTYDEFQPEDTLNNLVLTINETFGLKDVARVVSREQHPWECSLCFKIGKERRTLVITHIISTERSILDEFLVRSFFGTSLEVRFRITALGKGRIFVDWSGDPKNDGSTVNMSTMHLATLIQHAFMRYKYRKYEPTESNHDVEVNSE